MKILTVIAAVLLFSFNASAVLITHNASGTDSNAGDVYTDNYDPITDKYWGQLAINSFFSADDVFGSSLAPTSGIVTVIWGFESSAFSECAFTDECYFSVVSRLQGTGSSGSPLFTSVVNESYSTPTLDGNMAYDFSETLTFDAVDFHHRFNNGEIFTFFNMESLFEDDLAEVDLTHFINTSFQGSFTEVPEPAGLAILSIGLLALVRRRSTRSKL